jgi:hypothetical protein
MKLVKTSRPRRARWLPPAAAAAIAALVLAACGSASHPAKTASSKVPPIEAPCQQVAAVLSDGPDPGADPVGYAQAQIIQLRDLKLSQTTLTDAVDALASAYQQFSATNGSAAAKAAVNKTSRALNAICPGATS